MDTATEQPAPETATEEQPAEDSQSLEPRSSYKSPRDFYAEITKRDDVRAILEELAST